MTLPASQLIDVSGELALIGQLLVGAAKSMGYPIKGSNFFVYRKCISSMEEVPWWKRNTRVNADHSVYT
jgi:hypothetical protein